MRFLHTESSSGWGGQEIRILREMEGMRNRGHELILAVATGGRLGVEARSKGFLVYEMSFKKISSLWTIFRLLRLLAIHRIDLINTHSSLDAWIGGTAGRIAGKKIVRTRHLSTPIRKGLNSWLLYKKLADFVVTTSSAIIPTICAQAKLSTSLCKCIPTGVEPRELEVSMQQVQQFRLEHGILPEDCLVGTVCFVRSWKGVEEFLQAAHQLKGIKNLKWMVVGGGYLEKYQARAKEMQMQEVLIFTGHLPSSFIATAALDIFALLSTAHEGISQASLQAAFLEKPLVTTRVGGLPEVCLEGKTGFQVPVFAPEEVAKAVLKLKENKMLRKEMGRNAKRLVEEKFTFAQTLDQMEAVYYSLR